MTYEEFSKMLVASNLDSTNEYWDTEEKVIANLGGYNEIGNTYYYAKQLASVRGWDYALRVAGIIKDC